MNWIRLLVPWTVAAKARASAVLPVPGASSSSRCPSARRQVTANRMTGALPRRASPTLSTIRAKVPANHAAFSGVKVTSSTLLIDI